MSERPVNGGARRDGLHRRLPYLPMAFGILLGVTVYLSGRWWEPWAVDAVLPWPADWKSRIRISPDRRRLLVHSLTNHVTLWDVASGRPLAVFAGTWTGDAAFSPDGTRVVIPAYAGSCFAAERLKVHYPRGFPGAVALDPASPLVVDATSGECVGVLRGHTGQVSTAAYSPDGGRIVTGSADTTARVWDARSRSCLLVLRGNSGVYMARFSPDGSRIVTLGNDSKARLWNAETGESLAVVGGKNNGLKDLFFSSDGGRIILAAWLPDNERVHILDAKDGSEVALLDNVPSWGCSPDGKRLVTIRTATDSSAVIRVVSTETGTARVVIPQYGYSGKPPEVGFVPDGRAFINERDSLWVQLWNVDPVSPDVDILDGETSSARCLGFSPGGGLIVTAGSSLDFARPGRFETTAPLRVWDGRTGELAGEFGGFAAPYVVDDRLILATDPEGRSVILRRKYPRQWWGIAATPEPWLIALLWAALVWSFSRWVTTPRHEGQAQLR